MIDRSTDIRRALRERQRGFLLNPYRFGVSPVVAPFTWDKVVLALSGENILDESQYEWKLAAGSASSDAAQAKFGARSIWTHGGTLGLNSVYALPRCALQGDATIDAWIYPNSATVTQVIVGQRSHGTANGWELVGKTAGELTFQGTSSSLTTATGLLIANAWQHVRLVKSGGTGYLFHNGLLKVSGAITIGNNTGSTAKDDGSMVVGGWSTNPYTGYSDEIIVSAGEALTTADFAVPTAPATRGSFAGFSTWNAADKNAAVVLSAGARNASTVNSTGALRGTLGHSTGKYYFEVSGAGGNSGPDQIFVAGVGNASAALTAFPGVDANGWGFYPAGPLRFTGGNSFAYGNACDTFGVMWDATTGEVSFKTSASAPSVAFSGVSGTLYPMWGSGSSAGSRQAALNTGATAFTWGLPAGFSAWG